MTVDTQDLRSIADGMHRAPITAGVLLAAADEIDALRAEIALLPAPVTFRTIMEQRDEARAEVADLNRRRHAILDERDNARAEVARLRAALDQITHLVLVLWANGAEDANTTLNAVGRIVEPIAREALGEGT